MGLVRWGLLSTANIGRAIVGGAADSPIADVVAVGSRDKAKATEFAREHGIERAHGSYEELLADPELDVVYVALPNTFHVEWSIRALEAGKHVLCEKPLSRDPAEVERAFDAAERSGRLLMEGFMYRHHPRTLKFEELVRGGAIGELRLVRSQFGFLLEEPTNVRLNPEIGGGGLLDVGCYCVSSSRLLAGEPEVVYAQQTLGPTGVDVRFVATMRFAGGVLGHFDCGLDVPDRQELEAVGSEGSLITRGPFTSDDAALELRRGEETEAIGFEPLNRYRCEVEDFSRAVLGDEQPRLGRSESVAQARALDALIRSAESGSPGRLVPSE